MTLGRRDFLQRLSAVLAALGVTDSWLAGSVGAYQSAFAETNQRFALLVGINAYPEKVWRSPAKVETERFLQGAVTDVELQRELLIHRLGVDPKTSSPWRMRKRQSIKF